MIILLQMEVGRNARRKRKEKKEQKKRRKGVERTMGFLQDFRRPLGLGGGGRGGGGR